MGLRSQVVGGSEEWNGYNMIEGIPWELIFSTLRISRPECQTTIRTIQQSKLEVQGDMQDDASLSKAI